MKNSTRLLSFLLVIVMLLSFTLTSCGKNDTDPNPDGEGGVENDNSDKTPNGGEGGEDKPVIPPKEMLKLTENGKANFNLVYNTKLAGGELHSTVRKIQTKFEKAGVEVNFVNSETEDQITDCEILIGPGIDNRPGCEYDVIPLGNEGYIIQVIGNKIIINGGNKESTVKALKWFFDTYLKINEADTDLKNLSVEKDFKTEIKQEFAVKSIAVDGTDFSKFSIKYDENSTYSSEAAEELHARIYQISGYWLGMKSLSDECQYAIVLNEIDDGSPDGYTVHVEGGSIIINCAFSKVMAESTHKFINSAFSYLAEGDIVFDKDYKYKDQIRNITYMEYGGAVGDGRTDDFEAIKKTHERANFTGQTVMADPGHKFYIGPQKETIKIRTNTIWTGAEIIFDDRDVEYKSQERKVNVFEIVSDSEQQEITELKTLREGTTNIGLKFDGPKLLHVFNENKMQFIRYGGNANNGTAMQEIIIVDKDGNVDPLTPVIWDYETVTKCIAYPIDDKPITLSGGKVTTYANQAPEAAVYYRRGIGIYRSNTTIKNLDHVIRQEGKTGSPYEGFLLVLNTANVEIRDTKLQGHKMYPKPSNPNIRVGTYDYQAKYSHDVRMINVTQNNDINDRTCWGVMASNFCKNLKYDGCELSRFDAHMGVWNATIINSKLGHQRINAIGGGNLHIENCIISGNSAVNLRSDYGSTWRGDLTLKNITLDNTGTVDLISGSWNNHDFGYTCYMPQNVIIDGLTVMKPAQIRLIGQFAPTGQQIDTLDAPVKGGPNVNPYMITKQITIVNRTFDYTISPNSFFNKVNVIEK